MGMGRIRVFNKLVFCAPQSSVFPQGTASAPCSRVPAPRETPANRQSQAPQSSVFPQGTASDPSPKSLTAPNAVPTPIPGVQRAGALGVPLGEGGFRGIEKSFIALELT